MNVCGGQVMELFRAHELMALVIGNEDYDWEAFEQSAKYKGGYTSGDATVRNFKIKQETPKTLTHIVSTHKFISFLLIFFSQII